MFKLILFSRLEIQKKTNLRKKIFFWKSRSLSHNIQCELNFSKLVMCIWFSKQEKISELFIHGSEFIELIFFVPMTPSDLQRYILKESGSGVEPRFKPRRPLKLSQKQPFLKRNWINSSPKETPVRLVYSRYCCFLPFYEHKRIQELWLGFVSFCSKWELNYQMRNKMKLKKFKPSVAKKKAFSRPVAVFNQTWPLLSAWREFFLSKSLEKKKM